MSKALELLQEMLKVTSNPSDLNNISGFDSVLSNVNDVINVDNKHFHIDVIRSSGALKIVASDDVQYDATVTMRKDGAVEFVGDSLQDCMYANAIFNVLTQGPTIAEFTIGTHIKQVDGINTKAGLFGTNGLHSGMLVERLKLWYEQDKVPPMLLSAAKAYKAGYDAMMAVYPTLMTKSYTIFDFIVVLTFSHRMDWYGGRVWNNVANVVLKLNSNKYETQAEIKTNDGKYKMPETEAEAETEENDAGSSFLALGKDYLSGIKSYQCGSSHWYNIGLFTMNAFIYKIDGETFCGKGFFMLLFGQHLNSKYVSAMSATLGQFAGEMTFAVELASPTTYRMGGAEYPIKFEKYTLAGKDYLVPTTFYGPVAGRLDVRYNKDGDLLQPHEGDVFNPEETRYNSLGNLIAIDAQKPLLLCAFDHVTHAECLEELLRYDKEFTMKNLDDYYRSTILENRTAFVAASERSAIDKDGNVMVQCHASVDIDPDYFNETIEKLVFPQTLDDAAFMGGHIDFRNDNAVFDGRPVSTVNMFQPGENTHHGRENMINSGIVTDFVQHANEKIADKHHGMMVKYQDMAISAIGGCRFIDLYQLIKPDGKLYSLYTKAYDSTNPLQEMHKKQLMIIANQCAMYESGFFLKPMSNYTNLFTAVGLLEHDSDGKITMKYTDADDDTVVQKYTNPDKKLTEDDCDKKILFNFNSAWANRFLPGMIKAAKFNSNYININDAEYVTLPVASHESGFALTSSTQGTIQWSRPKNGLNYTVRVTDSAGSVIENASVGDVTAFSLGGAYDFATKEYSALVYYNGDVEVSVERNDETLTWKTTKNILNENISSFTITVKDADKNVIETAEVNDGSGTFSLSPEKYETVYSVYGSNVDYSAYSFTVKYTGPIEVRKVSSRGCLVTVGDFKAAVKLLEDWLKDGASFDLNKKGAAVFTQMCYRFYNTYMKTGTGYATKRAEDVDATNLPDEIKKLVKKQGSARPISSLQNDIALHKYDSLQHTMVNLQKDIHGNVVYDSNGTPTLRRLTKADGVRIMMNRTMRPCVYDSSDTLNDLGLNRRQIVADSILLGIYDLARVDDTLYITYVNADGTLREVNDVATTVQEKISRVWGSMHTSMQCNDPDPRNGSNRQYALPGGQDPMFGGEYTQIRTGSPHWLSYGYDTKTLYEKLPLYDVRTEMGTRLFGVGYTSGRGILFNKGYVCGGGGDAMLVRMVGKNDELDRRIWKYYGQHSATVKNNMGYYYYQNSKAPPAVTETNPLAHDSTNIKASDIASKTIDFRNLSTVQTGFFPPVSS